MHQSISPQDKEFSKGFGGEENPGEINRIYCYEDTGREGSARFLWSS